MRLKKGQIGAMSAALSPHLKNHPAELRLFGSRTQDELKGGDIDLLLVVDQPEFAFQLTSQKHLLLASIKKQLGDQKIDLTIATKNEIPQDPFLAQIWPQSILLHRF